ERSRGRAFEVDAGDLEAAAVAGAFELLLALQPVRRATEVRAGGAESVDEAVVAHDPGVLVLVALDDFTVLVLVLEADLELARRLGQNVGEQEANSAEDHAEHRRREGDPGDGEPAAEQA